MLNRLNELVDAGVVYRRSHPTLPLTIYNYSQRCQYERLWCGVSLQCRGLIMCDERVVARPFRKFFNDTEHQHDEIPWHLPSEVTEKLDGSLLIVFFFGGRWHAATRGSFESEQSVRGLEILTRKYGIDYLKPEFTYLFEVIYPANRVVVDYGDREDVVLLGIIHTETGVEHSLDDAPELHHVRRQVFGSPNFAALRAIIKDDAEGYVVRFDNGFRVKVKGENYLRLHRILAGVSSRSIWERLSSGQSLDEMLSVIPDEFAQWVRCERDILLKQHRQIMDKAERATMIVGERPTRKELAAHIMSHYADVKTVAFAMLDNKRPEQVAWQLCYPDWRVPQKLADLSG